MKAPDKKDQIVLSISGGAGKNIMATAVVEAIKKQFPNSKIVIVSPWHKEVWANNPNVSFTTDINKDFSFYKKHILNTDSLFLSNDPYLAEQFVYKDKNLIQVWCEMNGIKYNGELPKLYFTEEENKKMKDKLPKDKKLFFIQTSGGAPIQKHPISWMRDMPLPFAQKVVNYMNSKGYRTIHLRRADQYPLENEIWIPMTTREVLCSVQFADKSLFIDSVAQHASAAVGKQAVVTWIGNKPKVFGYDLHINIAPNTPNKFRHYIDSYFEKFDIAGRLHECPYNTNEIFDFEEIKKALE